MPAITRMRTVLRDADEAYDFIERRYARVRARAVGEAGSPALEFQSAATPTLAVDVVHNRISTSHSVLMEGDCAFALCLSGGWRYDAGPAGSGELGAGSPVAYPDGRVLVSRWSPFDALTLRVPRGEVARVAEEATGASRGAFRFTAMTPMTREMSSFWASTMRHYAREAMAADSLLTSPLVHQAAIDAMCASALATFPNTSTTATASACGRVGPDRVRRAEEFIHGHASLPITLSDIAAAAGCSPRELRAAFRTRWEVSPMGYLRDVRLEQAHRELDRLEPGTTSVADVARRWGFAHTGRFRAALHRRYGREPVGATGPVGGVSP